MLIVIEPDHRHQDNVSAASPGRLAADDAVRRVLAGETDAFADVVRQHQGDVWKVVVAIVGDEALSETLVHQTFVNAYERLGQFRSGELARWLKGIARNLVREELRRSSRESRRLRHYRDYLVALYDDDDRAEAHERALERAVAACRDNLAPASLRAMTLYYDQALDLAGVASAIGRSITATRQLLFRARSAVRACVEQRLAAE
jgi:RNA polymerase sigma-70 factor (ECF subfamily)